LYLDAPERVIEQQVVVKFGWTGPIIRLEAKDLDFVQPVADLPPEVLTQFRGEIEADQLDEMPVQRRLQAEYGVLDELSWI
jgi:hypothetical protein